MTPVVHILATVRKRELLPAALLVFRSLRIGFPTATVCVWGNGLDSDAASAVGSVARSVGAQFTNVPATSHDRWIEHLVLTQVDPFWICDTDIVFVESVQEFPVPEQFSGRFEPGFYDPWTKTSHVERLHTCLLLFNPSGVRAAMYEWSGQLPEPWRGSAVYPFIRMNFIPNRGMAPTCYDTCAGLWQAGMGTAFTESQDMAFDHLHAATYVDMVDAPELAGLADCHNEIYRNPEAAIGLREIQRDYYKQQEAHHG